MNTNYYKYDQFFEFIDTWLPSGFQRVNTKSSLLLELERKMEKNKQFFCILDVINMKIVFTSNRSAEMIGIEPEMTAPHHFFEATHPDDLYRHSHGREKIFKTAHELYIAGKGKMLLSSCLRMRNHENKYPHVLFQCYLFYSEIPYKTVYLFEVHTEIDSSIKIKNGFHYYFGNDMSLFRYPDEALLNTGMIFSDREFEVIKLLEKGMTTEQIAASLFISPLTVNTHRSNILHKSGKATTAELVHSLMELGVL